MAKKKSESRQIRLTITTPVANDEEEAKVNQWIEEFVRKFKTSFPLKSVPKAMSERIVSKPKDPWKPR
jgi:hypothetical protein